jgi:hypothetical protein
MDVGCAAAVGNTIVIGIGPATTAGATPLFTSGPAGIAFRILGFTRIVTHENLLIVVRLLVIHDAFNQQNRAGIF